MQEVKCELSHLSAGRHIAGQNAPAPLITSKEKKLQRKCFRAVRYARINVSQGYTKTARAGREFSVTALFSTRLDFWFFFLLAHLDHGLISFY